MSIFCGAGILVFVMGAPSVAVAQAECDDWTTLHPEWVFCDDFEDDGPLVQEGRYFEHDDNGGEFVPMDGIGFGGSRAMRALWQAGEVNAGSIKLGFGRNPSGYMDQGIRSDEDFRELYYRLYLKMQLGWQGNPYKLSRATAIAAADWSQAMIAHLWEGNGDALGVDPVRCVGPSDDVVCIGYNDFAHMTWLGYQSGLTPVFSSALDDQWLCVETHVRLNDAGQSNGVQEFWIDGGLEARRDQLDFVASYTGYAINAIFFENYDNNGSVREQERYIDNIVVSTTRVGCMDMLFKDGFECANNMRWTVTSP